MGGTIHLQHIHREGTKVVALADGRINLDGRSIVLSKVRVTLDLDAEEPAKRSPSQGGDPRQKGSI